MSETSRFFDAQIKLGAIPDAAVGFNLLRNIGVKRAKQYGFLGDTMDARTALGLTKAMINEGHNRTLAEPMNQETKDVGTSVGDAAFERRVLAFITRDRG